MTGAKAWEERLKMKPVGIRSLPGGRNAFLFRDAVGALWEYGFHGKTFIDLIEVPESEAGRYSPWP
jgi:hypothetical protein